MLPGTGGGRHRESFEGDGNVLYHDCGGGCTTTYTNILCIIYKYYITHTNMLYNIMYVIYNICAIQIYIQIYTIYLSHIYEFYCM